MPTVSDALEGFERTSATYRGKRRDVFRVGTGPAVIVIAEMPGITPKVAEFGRAVAGIGCTRPSHGRPSPHPRRASSAARSSPLRSPARAA